MEEDVKKDSEEKDGEGEDEKDEGNNGDEKKGEEGGKKDSEKKGIKMIDSSAQFKNPESNAIWTNLLLSAEQAYNDLIANGESPQIARNVLPISLKTEIIVSANFREWREILKQRTAPSAHPEIREIMINLLNELNEIIPVIFEDIEIKE